MILDTHFSIFIPAVFNNASLMHCFIQHEMSTFNAFYSLAVWKYQVQFRSNIYLANQCWSNFRCICIIRRLSKTCSENFGLWMSMHTFTDFSLYLMPSEYVISEVVLAKEMRKSSGVWSVLGWNVKLDICTRRFLLNLWIKFGEILLICFY